MKDSLFVEVAQYHEIKRTERTLKEATTMKRFVETRMTLPKDFVSKIAEPGTSAYEYLRGRRNPVLLMEDQDLLFIIDDKHSQGGLLYVFKDHSSVVFKSAAN